MAGRTTAKPFVGRQQRLVFFLGLLLATIAAILVIVIASSGGGGGGTSNQVPVVTASETIPAQTRVTSDMLEVTFVDQDEALTGAFSSRGQVIDRVTTEEIAAGAQIQTELVSSSVGEGVSFVVEPGYRAVSVEVQEVVTAGGNLKPGDHVDIVGIFELEDVQSANLLLQVLGLDYQVAGPSIAGQKGEEGPDNLVLTATMLQNVRLLAIAQSLTEDTAGGTVADEAAEADANPRAATATLELTPQQAQEITWADQFGTLRMVARAVGDDAIVAVVPTVSGEEIVAGDVVQADSLAEVVPLERPGVTCAIDRCGQRAVSVAVADITASGGLIRAGDRVDIVLAFQDASAVTILQDIEVLSIDQDIGEVVAVPSEEAPGEERTLVSQGEEHPQATTATLALWPNEAQMLLAAEEFTEGEQLSLTPRAAAAIGVPEDAEFDCKGSVRLVLRHVGQQGPVELEPRGVCAKLFDYVWG